MCLKLWLVGVFKTFIVEKDTDKNNYIFQKGIQQN